LGFVKENIMSDNMRETTDRVTIIERRGGGGTVLLAIVLLIAVVVGGVYLFNVQQAQTSKDHAIAGAATSVSHAADKVGDAVSAPSGK
jgi:uncharacterized protein HemX